MKNTRSFAVDPSKDKYPFCIVWSPLPPISWLFPFIGHTGICDSNGTLYDFAGPYTIGVGKLAFGPPTRYIQLDPTFCTAKEWDAAVHEGCEIYRSRMHNIFCDNCHSHVAKCLNLMGYGVWFFFQGKFVSIKSFFISYTPFLIVVLIIALLNGFL
eukprot:gene14864-19980_t